AQEGRRSLTGEANDPARSRTMMRSSRSIRKPGMPTSAMRRRRPQRPPAGRYAGPAAAGTWGDSCAAASAERRDEFLSHLGAAATAEEVALWAQQAILVKNTLQG